MADLNRTVEVLSKFSLQNLSEEWVKSCWENDFAEIPELEPLTESEIQENDFHVQNLYPLLSVTEDWISNGEGHEGEGFWMVLVENNISHKNLIALLAYLVDAGSKRTAPAQQREAAILSSSNYFKLLTVPGSAAFKIFHPVLYEKCVDILKMWTSMGSAKRKKSVSPANSQKRKKSKGNKKRQNSSISLDDFEDETNEEEELAPQEINNFRKLLLTVLQVDSAEGWFHGLRISQQDGMDLTLMLMSTSLRQSESSTYQTIQVLSALTRQDAELFNGNFGNFQNHSKAQLTRISPTELAYKGLHLLSLPLHGHVVSVVNAICKCLLPNILMLIGDNKVAAQTIAKPALMARDQAISFIIFLMKNEERAIPSVRTLLQHLCTKVTDRAEYRAKVAQAVVDILQELPSKPYGKMVEWFYRLSKHAKMNNRAFTLDIVSLLLKLPERPVDDNMSPEIAAYIKHTSLLGILLERCSDAAPTVRSRAITAFAQCFTSVDVNIKKTLQEIVTPAVSSRPITAPRLVPTPEREKSTQQTEEVSRPEIVVDKTAENGKLPEENNETPVNQASKAPPKTPFHLVALTPFNPNLPDEQGVLSMFRRRARDEKVHVRKAALQAIEFVIRFEAPDYRRQDLDVLVERCRDPALSVRKQAMHSLTDLLLDMPSEKPLQQCWLNGVLPLVIDRETTLQEKCMEFLEETVIKNIVPFNRSKDESHQLVWDLLGIMTQFESCDLRRYLQKACRHWARLGKIKATLISSLETHTNTVNNQAAWMLLAEIAPAIPKLNHSFVLDYWEQHASCTDGSEYHTLQRVLMVISCCSKHIQDDKRDKLIENLKDRLKRFDSPPELISITINTLSKLCEARAESTNMASDKESWCTDLLHASDKYLSSVILQEDGGMLDEDLVVRHLFTLGEIAQLCPARTPKRVFLIAQSMIAAPCISNIPSTQNAVAASAPAPSDHWTSGSSHDSSHGNHSGESADTNQDEAHSSRSSQKTQFTQYTQFTQMTQFRGSKMSNRIRAYAFIALGKLCLQNPDLAKKCVAALARELEISTDPTIRNNVVIIMCDLCVRYTTTADRYLPSIAACLKDEAPLVRKQTLTLITRLLQEDFLKWKGSLFFRFITTLLDDNKEIADFAEFCLVHMLLLRKPTMFSQHFIECIFHFNGYEDYGAYNKFPQTDREKKMFRLRGSGKANDRLKLYCFMLEHMTDEHRFQMTAKICTEILGGVVDNVIPLNEESAALLKDALAILSCKEIKLSSLKTKPQDDVAGDEQEMAAIVLATAKKTLITQVVKKNVIENIVPIVVSLKHMLEKHRSPVLKDLMCYLRELMKDYKNEVKEILSADRQLANEIEFDLRKFEEEEEEMERRKNQQNTVQSLQTTPAAGQGSPAQNVVAGSPHITPLARPDVAGTCRTPLQSPTSSTGRPSSVSSSRSSPSSQNIKSPLMPAPILNISKSGQPQSPASGGLKSLVQRDTSLSTLAILNSARKAFERAKENSPSIKKKEKTKSNLVREEESSEETPPLTVRFSDDLPSASDSSSTPPRATRSTNRAISTPSGALDNITFHIDQNVTLIPPSPIPSSIPINVYPPGSDSDPPTCIKKKDHKKPGKDFVYMFSPDKPLPKPRKWNIKSPAPPLRKNISMSAEEDDILSLSKTDVGKFRKKSNTADGQSKGQEIDKNLDGPNGNSDKPTRTNRCSLQKEKETNLNISKENIGKPTRINQHSKPEGINISLEGLNENNKQTKRNQHSKPEDMDTSKSESEESCRKPTRRSRRSAGQGAERNGQIKENADKTARSKRRSRSTAKSKN